MMMKKYLLALSFCLLGAAASFAQEVKPSPRPAPPADNDVVKISTNLIQVDVTVIDSKGKVITDLRPEEIEIYENGQKQKISHFSFISTIRATTEKPVAANKDSVPVPVATLRADQIHRTIALVVDDLSLSFESAYSTRRALKKFVDEQVQPGDLVAIIRTGAGIGALQQFTSDKRILYAAMEKVKWNPLGSGGIGAFAPIEPPPPMPSPADSSDTEAGATQKDGAKALDDFRSTIFATGTLGALRYIVGGMGELPGRKSVILFSDGFKLLETDENGFQESGRVLDFLKQLVDDANRSSVVFYTVDARGLQYTGLTAADSIQADTPAQMNAAINSAIKDRSDHLADTQQGLSFLADETGGFSVKNNNDLAGGVRQILDDQSYYLVAYEPDSDTFDPAKRKYNKLEIKVSRKGAKARYRSGFFNVADKPAAKTPSVMTPAAQLAAALVSPFSVSGIGLRLNALFGSDTKNGSFVRSLLHINASDLKFIDDKNNTKKAVFAVLAMSFGDNGQPGDQISKSYTLTVGPEAYKRVMSDGFVYHFSFPVKKPGAYQYRVAIRDEQGGKVGSASEFIEVPDVKKKQLTTSSIVIESLSEAEWKKFIDPAAPPVRADPMADTAMRRIKVGTVMRYGYEIYNARLDASKLPHLTTKIRVFRDGKVILDGQQIPFDMRGQTDLEHLKTTGAIALGDKMQPGDYILQVIVTDPLAKAKHQIATHFVQFEVVP